MKQTTTTDTTFKPIYKAYGYLHAIAIQRTLEAAGIPVKVQQGTRDPSKDRIGWLDVMVPEDRVDDVRYILAEKERVGEVFSVPKA